MSSGYIPEGALKGSMRDFRVPGGSDLLGRVEGFYNWQNLRRESGLWPFSRPIDTGPSCTPSGNIILRWHTGALRVFIRMRCSASCALGRGDGHLSERSAGPNEGLASAVSGG